MITIRHAAAFAAGLLLAGSIPLADQSPPQTLPAAQAQPPGGGRRRPPGQGAEDAPPLVSRFDRNRDKRRDREERAAAREYLAANPELRRPLPRPRITRTGTPGVPLTPKDVKHYSEKTSLYDAE